MEFVDEDHLIVADATQVHFVPLAHLSPREAVPNSEKLYLSNTSPFLAAADQLNHTYVTVSEQSGALTFYDSSGRFSQEIILSPADSITSLAFSLSG